jgi:hypothetical protein
MSFTACSSRPFLSPGPELETSPELALARRRSRSVVQSLAGRSGRPPSGTVTPTAICSQQSRVATRRALGSNKLPVPRALARAIGGSCVDVRVPVAHTQRRADRRRRRPAGRGTERACAPARIARWAPGHLRTCPRAGRTGQPTGVLGGR